MKFYFKRTLSVVFFVFVLLFISQSFISAGVLKHTVISPFGHEVAQDETTYESGVRQEPTSAIIDNAYSEFQEYDDNLNEPFCRIGGMYEIEVFNDARPGAKSTNNTYKLYYCKTTKDIIEKIKIPESWSQNANLTLYCNDGGSIKAQKYNFDFITSSTNTYKTCVLKNMDLESNNTIIYGFDVGNRLVDKDMNNIYDFNAKTGSVLQDLVFYRDLSSETFSNRERVDTSTSSIPALIRVPYIQGVTSEVCYNDEGGSSCVEIIGDAHKQSFSQAIEWAKENVNIDIIYLEEKTNGDHPLEVCNSVDEGGSVSCLVTSDSYTEYFTMVEVQYPIGIYEFKGKFNESYIFDYDSFLKFYSLGTTSEELTIPLGEVFPSYTNIGLSRVVLFKKINDKIVTGYEQNAKQRFEGFETFENDLQPVYKISIDNNFNFYTQNDCLEFLNFYDSKDSMAADYNDQILCYGNVIELISSNINDDTNPDRAFHLFKNIILSIK